MRQDPNIPSSLFNSALSQAAKTITGLLTLTKPDGKDSNHEADAKSETSETTAVEVGHMTLPSPDPKTYSQKDFEKFKEKLEEDFRYQFQVDKTILEKEIKNQFMFQIEALNLEHQNQ